MAFGSKFQGAGKGKPKEEVNPEKDVAFIKAMDDLDLEKVDLGKAIVQQAALFTTWGARWAGALRTAGLLKIAKKDRAGERYKHYAVTLKNASPDGKSPTGGIIDANVDTDPMYIAISNELVEAEYQEVLLGIIKDGFLQRDKSLERLLKLYYDEKFAGSSLSRIDKSLAVTDMEKMKKAESSILKDKVRKEILKARGKIN